MQCFPSIALRIGPFRCIPGRSITFYTKTFEGEKKLHKQEALREFGHYAAMNILGMIGISCYILAEPISLRRDWVRSDWRRSTSPYRRTT